MLPHPIAPVLSICPSLSYHCTQSFDDSVPEVFVRVEIGHDASRFFIHLDFSFDLLGVLRVVSECRRHVSRRKWSDEIIEQFGIALTQPSSDNQRLDRNPCPGDAGVAAADIGRLLDATLFGAENFCRSHWRSPIGIVSEECLTEALYGATKIRPTQPLVGSPCEF